MYFGHSSFSKLSVVKDQCVVKYPGTDIENMGIYAAVGIVSSTNLQKQFSLSPFDADNITRPVADSKPVQAVSLIFSNRKSKIR
jgi:hypothetical protein